MFYNLKRIISIAAALSIIVSLAACGGGKEAPGQANKSGTEAPKELKEIKVEIFDRGNVPEGQGTIDNNKWTKWVSEQMNKNGIKVTFVPILRKDEITKLNVMFAANEAPDLIYTYSLGDFHRFAEMGALADLTEIIDKNGQNIKKFWEKFPGIKEGGIYKGKQFAVTGGSVDGINTTALYMRKDWLDKVGMGIPKNADEFYKTLKAFKDQDPAGVGKQAVVPLSVAVGGVGAHYNIGALLSEFGVENSLAYVDGKILPIELQPGYKDYLVYLNKLYKDGLIDKEFVTDTDAKKSKEQTFSNKVGAWCGNWVWINFTASGIQGLNHDMVSKYPDAFWTYVDSFPDKNGKIHKVIPKHQGFANMVPKTSKNVVEVVKYLDWMAKEGADTIINGFENERHIVKNGVKIPKDLKYNAKDMDYIKWDMACIRPSVYDEKAYLAMDINAKFAENSANTYKKLLEKSTIPVVQFDRALESSTKYSDALVKLSLLYYVKAVTGSSPEKDYEAFKSEYLKSGGQEYIDEMTKVYKEMKNIK